MYTFPSCGDHLVLLLEDFAKSWKRLGSAPEINQPIHLTTRVHERRGFLGLFAGRNFVHEGHLVSIGSPEEVISGVTVESDKPNSAPGRVLEARSNTSLLLISTIGKRDGESQAILSDAITCSY